MAQIGPTVKNVLWYAMGIELSEVQMTLSEKTAKLLGLGISKLDEEALKNAIRKAPFLLIAGDESVRHGDKKYPMFVAFWDTAANAPWWGLFRMTSMDDKTAETQAKKMYETIIEELEYPPEKVLYVLSDNTASVSARKEGCVTLLQEKLRHKLTGTREPDVDQPARGGRGSRGRRGRGARGGGSDPSGRGGNRAAGRRGRGTNGGRSGICGRGLGRGTRGGRGNSGR